MPRIRKSKTDTTFFADIPTKEELEDEERLNKKYKKIIKGEDKK